VPERSVDLFAPVARSAIGGSTMAEAAGRSADDPGAVEDGVAAAGSPVPPSAVRPSTWAAGAVVGAAAVVGDPTVGAADAPPLAAVGRSEDERRRLEAEAYEHCVDTGEAAVGRAHFSDITAGGAAPWGAFKAWRP
jgi:hypothetical protein